MAHHLRGRAGNPYPKPNPSPNPKPKPKPIPNPNPNPNPSPTPNLLEAEAARLALQLQSLERRQDGALGRATAGGLEQAQRRRANLAAARADLQDLVADGGGGAEGEAARRSALLQAAKP